MSFPLYDNLLEQAEMSQPIAVSDVQSFTKQLKGILEIHELVYAIIRCHQLRHDTPETYLLPYGGKKLKKGIRFDFDKFPLELQHLLLTFLELHHKSEHNHV